MSGEQNLLAGVAADRLWRFAGIEFDERTLDLRVAGEAVEVDPKPLGVLRYLLNHAGEVVTKDELAEAVWPRRILSDSVLAKTVSRLREVLRDEEQNIIKTVHGYGYRLVAAVEVEESFVAAPTKLNLQSGDHPPLRPLWRLEERLGSGGHGEAWRAQHEKTREQRVFKFALDEASLTALKREITLFRVINDTLGDSGRVVALLDWNLEQLPYFLESEYITGGNLIAWAQARGGLAEIPLADRLDVVAQIAEALAAVHSVGVLHKDLKPSNILAKPVAGHTIDVRLADFGSGGVLDLKQIENLGITRLGFTKTVAFTGTSSGTPLYLPPEVLAGQPFTVKADIYALGVILYQFLAGDFRKVMSPGWERDIDDELLREDIALCAEGNLEARLSDAAELARRLRGLDERRTQREAERAKAAKAERVQRAQERAKARRVGLVAAIAALVIGLIASTALYFKARSAQARTEIAAAQSKAVTDFLSNDAFAPVASGAESVKNMTVIDLLTRAGKKVDERFAAQPAVAAELHSVIGRSLDEFDEEATARAHHLEAIEIADKVYGAGSEIAVNSAADLIGIDYVLDLLPESMPHYEQILAQARPRFDPLDPTLLRLRLRMARGHHYLGQWTKSADELTVLLADVEKTKVSPEFVGRAKVLLGRVLCDLGRYAEAEPLLRASLDELVKALGEGHINVSAAHGELGHALTYTGKREEAVAQLELAERLARRWAPDESWDVVRPQMNRAVLLLEEDRLGEAEALLAHIVSYQDVHQGERTQVDHTAEVRQALGETYLRQARYTEAVATLARALEVSIRNEGLHHTRTFAIRQSLAEALIAANRLAEGRQILTEAGPSEGSDLPRIHTYFAQRHWVQALIAEREGNLPQARSELTDSLKMFQAVYGTSNWRSLRGQQALARLEPAVISKH